MGGAARTGGDADIFLDSGPGARSMRVMPIRRALVVYQDNLLRDCADVEVDFVSTGASITPGCPDQGGPLLKALGRMAARRYDLVLLPAVDLNWVYDQPGIKRRLRSFIRAVLSMKIRMEVFGRKTRIGFLDRYDATDIYPEIPVAVGADLYFKANLKRAGIANHPFKVEFLPYWVYEENYPAANVEKKTDLFYCASPNSGARERASKELAVLAARGVSVDHPKDRIPFPEFRRRMGEALLTLSPTGIGYHGFRHYEAMLMQSVPVLNTNHDGVETDLAEGKTCLVYEDGIPGDLARRVEDALKDRKRLLDWGLSLREFASRGHSTKAVGDRILARMEALQ